MLPLSYPNSNDNPLICRSRHLAFKLSSYFTSLSSHKYKKSISISRISSNQFFCFASLLIAGLNNWIFVYELIFLFFSTLEKIISSDTCFTHNFSFLCNKALNAPRTELHQRTLFTHYLHYERGKTFTINLCMIHRLIIDNTHTPELFDICNDYWRD